MNLLNLSLVAFATAAQTAAPASVMWIQPILIVCGLGLTLFYFVKLKSALLDRLLVAVCFSAMALFVAKPEWSDAVAGRLGVESGRFLLLYFSVVFYLFLILLIFSHQRKMARDQTEIIRQIAIISARKPPAPVSAKENPRVPSRP